MVMHEQKKSTFAMNRGGNRKPPPVEYKDSNPEGVTDEEVKAKLGKVVWCEFTECIYNQEIEGLQRTTGTLTNNSSYKPINPQDHVWKKVCTRDTIALKFKTIVIDKVRHKVPACWVASSDNRAKMDWSHLLQPDGTPYGGSLESQNPDHAAFSTGGWGSWDSPKDQGSYDGDAPDIPIRTGGDGTY
tara:strand:- start:585 stop:1145 length:561 start_codon:yes stop_codon:yes gene_type:complete